MNVGMEDNLLKLGVKLTFVYRRSPGPPPIRRTAHNFFCGCNTTSLARPLLSPTSARMDISPKDFFLRALDRFELDGDAMGGTSSSGSTTPFETHFCSPLIFSPQSLAIDLDRLPQAAQMPSTSFEQESPALDMEPDLTSCCILETLPHDHSPHDAPTAAELFYTPQGIGEHAPLDESTPLLLQPTASNILPSNDMTDPTSTDGYRSVKHFELSELIARSLASVDFPITPSAASLILSFGDTALATYYRFVHWQQSAIEVLCIII